MEKGLLLNNLNGIVNGRMIDLEAFDSMQVTKTQLIIVATYSLILARASLNLTMASSCRTVIGIAAASPVSFDCRLISCSR